MSNQSNFIKDLSEQVAQAFCNGERRFVMWGLTPECLSLIEALARKGIPPEVFTAIIDPREEVSGLSVHGIKVALPEHILEIEPGAVVIASDEGKEVSLTQLAALDARTPRIIMAGMGHLDFRDPVFEQIVLSCLVKSYATGYENSLVHLYQAIRYIASKGLRGDVAEFGICKGGTVVFIKKVLDHFGLESSEVFGFDIFEGFPSKKSPLDLYRHHKCEFRDYDTVENYCGRFGIKVIKGDICETFRILEGRPLILSFFDTDNHSPVKASLALCAEQTVPGGVIAFDHFTTVPDYLYTIGERLAAKEILNPDKFLNLHGTGIFIKI